MDSSGDALLEELLTLNNTLLEANLSLNGQIYGALLFAIGTVCAVGVLILFYKVLKFF